MIRLRTLSTDEFVKRSKVIHKNKYDYTATDYVHGKLKVKITCPTHGEFRQSPNNHLNGSGCPTCKSSRGEMLIAQILSKHDIAFVQEYKLPNIHYKFRYDFYLPDYRLLIEFHGIQHYHPVGYFGG
jgi:hypothetical protein